MAAISNRRSIESSPSAHSDILQSANFHEAVHIIGVPLDLGGGRRGVDMGPSAFRIAGLGERLAALGYAVVDKGDLPAPIPETQELRDERKKYIRDIAKVCQKLYQTSLASLDEGAMPLVLGGDHSLAAGSVAAAAEWATTRRSSCRSACCGSTRTAT